MFLFQINNYVHAKYINKNSIFKIIQTQEHFKYWCLLSVSRCVSLPISVAGTSGPTSLVVSGHCSLGTMIRSWSQYTVSCFTMWNVTEQGTGLVVNTNGS